MGGHPFSRNTLHTVQQGRKFVGRFVCRRKRQGRSRGVLRQAHHEFTQRYHCPYGSQLETAQPSKVYVEIVLVNSQNRCWICRKFVFPEDSWPDAFGFALHKACSDQLAQEEHQLPAPPLLKHPPLLSRAAKNRA
jgi:hypothetical protein